MISMKKVEMISMDLIPQVIQENHYHRMEERMKGHNFQCKRLNWNRKVLAETKALKCLFSLWTIQVIKVKAHLLRDTNSSREEMDVGMRSRNILLGLLPNPMLHIFLHNSNRSHQRKRYRHLILNISQRMMNS